MTVTDPLLTRREAAELLRLRPQTLACWAMRGIHLPVVHVGAHAVRYRLSDIEAFIERSKIPAREDR